MPQIFSKKVNVLPHLSLGGALFGGVLTIFALWYYFSPEYTDVGYAPEQPVPYSHRLHVDQLGMDCRYCHNWVEVSDLSNVPPTTSPSSTTSPGCNCAADHHSGSSMPRSHCVSSNSE